MADLKGGTGARTPSVKTFQKTFKIVIFLNLYISKIIKKKLIPKVF